MVSGHLPLDVYTQAGDQTNELSAELSGESLLFIVHIDILLFSPTKLVCLFLRLQFHHSPINGKDVLCIRGTPGGHTVCKRA